MKSRRSLIRQREIDDLVDGDDGATRDPPVPSEPPEMPDEALEQLASAFTEALGGDGGDADAADDPRALTAALDDVHGKGRKLGQLGDCSLFVSDDGLEAVLRGALPAGTSQREVLDWLEQAGVCHGVIPGRIFDALPKRNRRREGRRSHEAGAEKPDVVVAEGEAPTPPGVPRIRHEIEVPEEKDYRQLVTVLQGQSLAEVRRLRVAAPLVQAGRVLARGDRQEGRPGRDVFGEPLAPPEAATAQLRAGAGAALGDDGSTVVAEITGYAGLLDGELRVVESVWVAADLLSAYWVCLPPLPPGDTPSKAHVRVALEETGICHGIQAAAISGLAQAWKQGAAVDTAALVARGTEAVRGTKGTWRFTVSPEETRYVREIERILEKAPRAEYVRSYARGLSAWLVNAGDRIAGQAPPTEGEMGRDVFGEEYLPDEPREERLQAGDHVAMSADGKSCHAEIFGVVAVEDDRVRVVPPLWLDPSRCVAYLLNLPQLGEPHTPTPAEIDTLIELFQITYGVDDTAIGVLCEKLHQGIPVEVLERVAAGDPPRRGRDGAFELAVELTCGKVAFLDDGSVDFRSAGQVQLVEAGTLIGARTPPTSGTPGKDLFGQRLEAIDGNEVAVDLGKGAEEVAGEAGVAFYRTTTAGEITFVDHRTRRIPGVYLAVHEVLVIDKDVDFHTGNIDYEGTVQVQGSVRAGFRVRAEGNIVVAGTIENGAHLEAGGSVVVRLGIVGQDTRVRAAGSVTAKFVQAADIRAGETVTVCEYLQEATVKADEVIAAVGRAGNRKSGALIGGQAMAGARIEVCRLGSESAAPTQAIAGVRPSDLRRLAELNRTVAQCEELRGRLLKAFGAEEMGTQKLRALLLAMLTRARGPRREAVAKSIKSFMKLQSRHEEALRERDEVQREIRRGPAAARIEVHGPVAPNVTVRIGEQSLRARDETAAVTDVTFALGKVKGGEVRLRILPNT